MDVGAVVFPPHAQQEGRWREVVWGKSWPWFPLRTLLPSCRNSWWTSESSGSLEQGARRQSQLMTPVIPQCSYNCCEARKGRGWETGCFASLSGHLQITPWTHTSTSHPGCSPWQPGQLVQHTAPIISGLIGMEDGNFNKACQLVLESQCWTSRLDPYTPSRERPSHLGENGGRNLLQLWCGTKQTGRQQTTNNNSYKTKKGKYQHQRGTERRSRLRGSLA